MRNLVTLALLILTPGAGCFTGHGQGHGHVGPATEPASMMGAVPITNISLFVQPLTIPSNAVPARVGPDGLLIYEMRLRANLHRFHPDLDPVPIWGYSDSPDRPGSSPGPTFQATNGIPIHVRWINQLPATFPDWIPADTIISAVRSSICRR